MKFNVGDKVSFEDEGQITFGTIGGEEYSAEGNIFYPIILVDSETPDFMAPSVILSLIEESK